MASGVSVAWDSTTELRSAYLAWDETLDVTFDFERGKQVPELVVGPFGELAMSYAHGRMRSRRSTTYAAALRDAHLLVDYWSGVPAVMSTGPTGGWNDGVLAGLELAGLSQLVRRADSSAEDQDLVARRPDRAVLDWCIGVLEDAAAQLVMVVHRRESPHHCVDSHIPQRHIA